MFPVGNMLDYNTKAKKTNMPQNKNKTEISHQKEKKWKQMAEQAREIAEALHRQKIYPELTVDELEDMLNGAP